MGNFISIWSKKEEYPETANGETSSSTNSNFDVKSLIPEETVNGVKTVSEEVENTGNANGEASIKRKRKIRKKNLATSGQEENSLSEELSVQSQVNDGQLIHKSIVRPLSEKPGDGVGNVEIVNNKDSITRSKKMLLILDVNGLLGDVIYTPPKDCKPDIRIAKRASKICSTCAM